MIEMTAAMTHLVPIGAAVRLHLNAPTGAPDPQAKVGLVVLQKQQVAHEPLLGVCVAPAVLVCSWMEFGLPRVQIS